MTAARPRVAEVVRRFASSEHFRPRSTRAAAILRRLVDCRTADLGGHLFRCSSCSHERISYNSCRDRHCPQCQAGASQDWLDARLDELLPVPHFHVVFTLPEELRPIALGNPRQVYALLFQVAAETLSTIGGDPKHLGAQLGFFGILHTWGQTLDFHPHVHFVVPGGGISTGDDGEAWLPSRPTFLLPVPVLRAYFRRRLLEELEARVDAGAIDLPEDLRPPGAWPRLRRKLAKKKWVVYAKEPFATPARVVEYLARYTHRVAIADGRLLCIDDESVTFRYQDYRTKTLKVMRLAGGEFLRRFCLHILPKRFVRIRYYGFLSHRNRKRNVARCRELIDRGGHAVASAETKGKEAPPPEVVADCPVATEENAAPQHGTLCPSCGKKTMMMMRELTREELCRAPPDKTEPISA